MPGAAEFFRTVADRLDAPLHGPAATDAETDYAPPNTLRSARGALLSLCGGDETKAATVGQRIVDECQGYMPHAAAVALIHAAQASGPVAPEVS